MIEWAKECAKKSAEYKQTEDPPVVRKLKKMVMAKQAELGAAHSAYEYSCMLLDKCVKVMTSVTYKKKAHAEKVSRLCDEIISFREGVKM